MGTAGNLFAEKIRGRPRAVEEMNPIFLPWRLTFARVLPEKVGDGEDR
jgi:hypothetical protein